MVVRSSKTASGKDSHTTERAIAVSLLILSPAMWLTSSVVVAGTNTNLRHIDRLTLRVYAESGIDPEFSSAIVEYAATVLTENAGFPRPEVNYHTLKGVASCLGQSVNAAMVDCTSLITWAVGGARWIDGLGRLPMPWDSRM